MKKIVLGNDFNLIIPVSRKVHTSTGDVIQDFNLLPACTDLQVNLVNFNETISLPCSVDVEHTSRLIANVDSSKLNIGNYALEVKGKIYGNAWRSNEYEQIAFVNNNASADEVFDGEIIDGESSVEVDHVFIILPPTAGFTEIIDQASNVDIDLNDANLEITRRTGEKKSFDLNTVNVEIGEGIKSIRRLEASPANKEISREFIQSNDFDSFLLGQGDYCGVFIPLDLYDFKDGHYVVRSDNYLFVMDPYYDDDDNLGGSMILGVRSECTEYDIIHTSSFRLHVTLTFEDKSINKDQELIIQNNFIRDPSIVCGINLFVMGSIEHSNDKRLAFFFSKGTDSPNPFNTIYLPEEFKYTSFLFNSHQLAKLFGASSKTNWVVEKNDGSLVRLGTTDNIVIGSDNMDYGDIHINIEGDRIVVQKPGSLTVGGTGRFKDVEVAKSLSVGSSLKVDGSMEVNDSITTHSTLKAGETTLNGTLHVEESDIKTKSVYPAKTGSSSLKDPSKGHVTGNYVVNKSSLGKGAHNYDKIFVEEICWSDCTNPGDISTSLNGKGTYPIYKLNGFDSFPTFYFSNEEYNTSSNTTDPNLGIGMYYNQEAFVLDHRDQNGYQSYARWEFKEDGAINFIKRDADDDTHTFGILTNKGYVYDDMYHLIPATYLDIVRSSEGIDVSSEEIMYTLGGRKSKHKHIKAICMSNPTLPRSSPILLTVIDNNYLSLLSDVDKTIPIGIRNYLNDHTRLYATDGSYFDTKKLVVKETVDFIADATTAEDVVTKFNQLLANLRSAGIMKSK